MAVAYVSGVGPLYKKNYIGLLWRRRFPFSVRLFNIRRFSRALLVIWGV